MDSIKVSIEGSNYSVIGGDFWDMLAEVKDVPGRKFVDKVWHLPCSLEKARELLAPLQIVNEDGQLEAEVADIQRVQKRVKEFAATIQSRSSTLYDEVQSYSRMSKSRVRAGKASTMTMLDYALQYADIPVEKLTEPQIKTLYAALREIGEE